MDCIRVFKLLQGLDQSAGHSITSLEGLLVDFLEDLDELAQPAREAVFQLFAVQGLHSLVDLTQGPRKKMFGSLWTVSVWVACSTVPFLTPIHKKLSILVPNNMENPGFTTSLTP